MFIFFILFNGFYVSSQIIEIENETSTIVSIEEQSLYFVDYTNELTFEEIQKEEAFLPFKDGARLVEPNTSFWLQIKVRNQKKESVHWVINFFDPDFSRIEFYDNKKVYTSGIDLPFTVKRFYHKNFIFPIHIESQKEETYWIKMISNTGANVKANLTSIESHQAYALSEYYLLGIYYGILFILSVYNMILFFHTKYRTYLYYVLYLISAILFSFNEDGLGFQFVWKEYPIFNPIINFSSSFLLLFSFLIFSTSFLEINKKSTRFKILLSLGVIAFISSVFQVFNWLPLDLGFIFYLLPFIFLFYLAIQKTKEKFTDSIYFLIGNSLILGSLIIYFLRLNNWIYSGVFEVYAFNFSVILEAVVLSMAVGNKIRDGIKKQHSTQEELIQSLKEQELLTKKVNRELEQKVSKRTLELEKQKKALTKNNEELNDLKKKLYDMNEALDLTNFKLKKEVDVFSKNQIVNQEVSYDRFMELYGEKHICLKYLKKLKEQKGFACKKCKGTSYKEKDNYIRQCQNCRQIESATANTIFHSIKFDLPKAFYLVYITNYDRSKFTLDQLSETLDLGRNSCWNFIKKVENKKELLIKGVKNKRLTFNDLIL